MSRIARIGGALLSILVRYPSSELKNGADNCLLAAHARWIIKDSCSGIFHGDSRDRAEIFERPTKKARRIAAIGVRGAKRERQYGKSQAGNCRRFFRNQRTGCMKGFSRKWLKLPSKRNEQCGLCHACRIHANRKLLNMTTVLRKSGWRIEFPADV